MWDNFYLVAAGGMASIIAYIIMTKRRKPEKVWPENMVILHQFERNKWVPSASPYCLKLETYLRMANIPYQIDPKMKFSRKGKVPWITYNGDEVADSSFCIEYLNKKLGVNLNEDIDSKSKAIAWAFEKMVEDNLYWAHGLWALVFRDMKVLRAFYSDLPLLLIYVIRRQIRNDSWGHGMGRHTQQEVVAIGLQDLTALSTFLGEKSYFLGERPTQVDCTIFGFLATIKYSKTGSPFETLLAEKLTNLEEYCDRMKTEFWPDWDDCITHGGTRKAIK